MTKAVHGILAGLAFLAAVPAAAQTIRGDPEQGAAIASQWCTICHAIDLTGRGTDVAPAFPTIARTRSPDFVRGFLAHPHTTMPPLDLSTREIEDIVAYLRTLQ